MRNVENTSYDRLFASQPGLPATGAIGNLIGTVASPVHDQDGHVEVGELVVAVLSTCGSAIPTDRTRA